MSTSSSTSKRGRKRNDNLPPNRARDVQRAFRARRAAHLQALEQRVTELEAENDSLRAALSLPPANRPALGKGPTGKDKPKIQDDDLSPRPTLPIASTSRTSSGPDSPISTRTNSMSPSAVTGSIRISPRDSHPLDGAIPWDQSILLADEEHDDSHVQGAAGSASSYQRPLMTPLPQRPVQTYAYGAPNRLYGHISQSSYPHTADRPMGNSYGASNFLVRDPRDDPQASQAQYSYSQPIFPSAHEAMPAQSPTSAVPQTLQSVRESSSGLVGLSSYPHRRSTTEPQGFRPIHNHFPHLPNPMQSAHLQHSTSPRLQDGHIPVRDVTGYNGTDGRHNTIS